MPTAKTIFYIFGNPLLDFDNLPIQITPDLIKIFPSVDFVIMDPNENLHPLNKEINIIDTIINTENVILITDIDKFDTQTLYSMHDLDLSFNLKLLKKVGELEKINIIGVPPHFNKKECIKQVAKIIRDITAKNIIYSG